MGGMTTGLGEGTAAMEGQYADEGDGDLDDDHDGGGGVCANGGDVDDDVDGNNNG